MVILVADFTDLGMPNHDEERDTIRNLPFVFISDIGFMLFGFLIDLEGKGGSFFASRQILDESNSEFISFSPMNSRLNIAFSREFWFELYPFWMLSIHDVLSFDFTRHSRC